MSDLADSRTEVALTTRACWKGLGIGGYSAKAAEVDVVELTRLLLVDRPRLRSIQQRRQYDSFVHLEFGAEVETSSFPDHVQHAPKGLSGFGDPMGDLIVGFVAAGEIVAQEREAVHRFKLGAIDIDPPLAGTQFSPVAPRSWVHPSGHTPGNRHDQWAKPAISDAAIDRLPQVDTNNDLDLPPSLPENIRGVQ
ncbi:unnamed protein product [Schistocephalus solidus]|uniref:FAA_hydrolase domain-containing protein n=1 Tax=Schistocephalus solidus TaxID=70667 RepID=A0A183T659_SCHSO|nr:unnamed protein product [Schistocephalus solidus]